MSGLLLDTVERHKSGEAVGVYSVCSAHPLVIEASMLQVLGEDSYLLVEATSNQVDQFGGYTGMKPRDFRRLVLGLAERRGLPEDRVVLGGGTSAFAGEILAPALSRRMGRRVDAVATTDVVSNPREYFTDDGPTLLVSFARSGNSPESVAATELADRLLSECHHLVLTCDRGGRLYERHEREGGSVVLLMPEDANDQGFAMTSSFTSMTLAAWLALGGGYELREPLYSPVVGAAIYAANSLANRLMSRPWPIRGGSLRVKYPGKGEPKR